MATRWLGVATALVVSLLLAAWVHMATHGGEGVASPDPRWRQLDEALVWRDRALAPPMLGTVPARARAVQLPLLPELLREPETSAPPPAADADSPAGKAPVGHPDAAQPPLPAEPAATTPSVPVPLWVRLPFHLAEDSTEAWVLQITHRPRMLVYLDGQLLGHTVPPAQADMPREEFRVGARRSLFDVPPAWLKAGDHVLELRFSHPSRFTVALSRVTLGPQAALEADDRQRNRWQALRSATVLAALVVGLFLLLAWLTQRHSRIYLLAGSHVLLLAVLLLPYVLPEQPLPSPWWRMVLDWADIGAKALLLASLALLARPLAPRLAQAALSLALGYAALACVLDGLAAWRQLPWADFSQPWPWWAIGSRVLVLGAAVAVALVSVWRAPRLEAIGTAILVALSAWLWAYVTFGSLVWPAWGVADVNVIAHAGWVVWVGVLLQRHFVDTARRERQWREEAAQALQQRTTELQASFAALRASENERLAAQERERLLQEMHDGLGSQLTAARMAAQSGMATWPEMVNTLDTCIQEMRLTVDALSVTNGDLGLLLASVRHRAEPALRAAGIDLHWRVQEAPCLPVLEGPGGRELVRIVQEALSNVMHHARASRVVLSTDADADSVRLRIADDGIGLPQPPRRGRGTRNIESRASRLQARVHWESPSPEAGAHPWGPRPGDDERRGTVLTLTLPRGRRPG